MHKTDEFCSCRRLFTANSFIRCYKPYFVVLEETGKKIPIKCSKPFFVGFVGSKDRGGATKTRTAVYRWLADLLDQLGPQAGGSYGSAAVETALYTFKREEGSAAQAAALAPLTAVLRWDSCPLDT